MNDNYQHELRYNWYFAIEMLTHFLVSQNEATKNNKTQ